MQADENDTSLSKIKSFMAHAIVLHAKVVWLLCDIFAQKSIVLFVCLNASLAVLPGSEKGVLGHILRGHNITPIIYNSI